MVETHDTIAAIATPPGTGGIGVVRVSGAQVPVITRGLVGRDITPRHATHADFCAADGQIIDTGICLRFVAPASFTGEDVLELQGHGGPVVLDMVMARVLELGARPARAGEFTERAFLNNKLDLAQAEAVADVIEAASEQAVRLAQRSLHGEFSTHVNELTTELIELRAYIEAAIDFPDEELDLLELQAVHDRITDVGDRLDSTLSAAAQGRLMREGVRCVLMGRPNVGKSSLLNALVGHERVIVTDIPGTTRDTVDESVVIEGLRVTFTDTAGLHEATDRVEQEGIARSHRAAAEADVVLVVEEATESELSLTQLPNDRPVLRVWNKVDLLKTPRTASEDDIYVSAHTGAGLDILCERIVSVLGFDQSGEGLFMARRRHIDALHQAKEAVLRANSLMAGRHGLELTAEELRHAAHALSEITGEFTSEDLLAEIFSRFCIGK